MCPSVKIAAKTSALARGLCSALLLLWFATACEISPQQVQHQIAKAKQAGAQIYAPTHLQKAQRALQQAHQSTGKQQQDLLQKALTSAKKATQTAVELTERARAQERIANQKKTAANSEVEKQRQMLLQKGTSDPIPIPSEIQRLQPQAIHDRQQQGDHFILIDVRASRSFARGHIVGAISMPAEATGYARFGKELDIVLYADNSSGPELGSAVQRLHHLGYHRVALLKGGLTAWQKAGLPWARQERADPHQQATLITSAQLVALLKGKNPPVLVDTRPLERFRAGHLPQAINLPMQELDKKNVLPQGPLIVYGADEVSGAKAAAHLLGTGRRQVRYLQGGIRAWVAAGGLLETGKQATGL